MRLSVLINICNERHLLLDCIQSVKPIASDVVVTDMQSSDGGGDLARSLGCTVLPVPWAAAVEPTARLVGIDKCAGDWILVMDPDMRLPEQTRNRITKIIELDEADAVDFYCENHYFGQKVKHGHGSQGVFRKLFKKRVFHPSFRSMHTFFRDSTLHCRILRLPRTYPITHLGYQSVGELTLALIRYAEQEARDDISMGVEFSTRRALVVPLKRFVGNYFLRLGLLDGWIGLIVCSLIAWYAFQKECYLWELSRDRDLHSN